MSEPNRQYHQALSANRKLLDEIARLHLQFANSEQENTRLNNYIERLEVRNAELVPENARLRTEVERLTFDPLTYLDDQGEWMPRHIHLAAVERLQAEVERLRKAGDELHAFLIDYIVDSRISSAYLNKLDDDWTNAAKEGKQP